MSEDKRICTVCQDPDCRVYDDALRHIQQAINEQENR